MRSDSAAAPSSLLLSAQFDRGSRSHGEQHAEVPDVAVQEHQDRGDDADRDRDDPRDLGQRHAAILPRVVAGPALTPPLALDYLDELSTDIRAAVVLGADGELAASSLAEERAGRMRELVLELLERAGDAWDGDGEGEPSQVEVGLTAGSVFVVHGTHWTIAVLTGRYALSSLMFYDLRSVIADLGEPGT